MKRNNFNLFNGILATLLLAVILFSAPAFAQKAKAKKEPVKKETAKTESPKKETSKKESAKQETKSDSIKSSTFGGLKWRSIGPAFTSGRIADFAVNPNNHSEWYVAVASGHVWKTMNNGTTFDPVFDGQKSYSIGVVVIDPNNTNVVWVGTGENNHQRALGYGDGVYKSTDGGKSWKNMGLKASEHIGKIVIDPRNSDIVFVAAEGSVWGPGGDRGMYKTIDGGKTWKKVLEISENTGVNNILIDPRNPDVMYASSEQRRRHVFTKIGGGPETAVYKSTNAGESWDKLKSGLPSVDMGGIGLAISPVNPDYIFAIIEAADDASGFYRSTNRGASWQKISDHSAQGQYYNEIYCDPKDVDKIYSAETVSQFTEDGGKTWKPIGNNKRHVDDHAIWIDPSDTKHLFIGGDGGIYESFDGGKEYLFKSNLPVTQMYRVQVDNSSPFYNVYGGTQDNNSFGGPSRNTSGSGVVSDDWFVTCGGDGFWSQVDPVNPNIVYSESQYGGMVRYDRKSQESIDIRPEPRKDELSYRWNWNTPLILSPHSPTRLYCAANKVFRSDDRGNTWQVISDDLTAQIDRNTWPVMGKYWSYDAVAKDISTSLYGTIVSMDESPVKENLLYAGTDDGVIQVTEDAGKTWTKTDKFSGVPENTYVSDIMASRFDENIVFASFDNILRDDFKPYLMKSSDKGHTWNSIAANLPKDETVHSIQQDFINPDLLFVGTEFSFYFSNEGGKIWVKLAGGMPSVPVRDITIQKRESDLAIATFGRGFYIMDDYSPLRLVTKDILAKEAHIFPVKDALMYIPSDTKYGQGSTYFIAKNPDFGAVFTYFLKDAPKTLKDLRHDREAKLFEKGERIPQPSDADLRAEREEIPAYLTFIISDISGNEICRINKAPSSGINRINWDLRYLDKSTVDGKEKYDPFAASKSGIPVMPGKYKVSLSITVRDTVKQLAGPVEFNAVTLNNSTLPAADKAAVADFQKKVAELSRVMSGTENYTEDLLQRAYALQIALNAVPGANTDLRSRISKVSGQLEDVKLKFNNNSNRPSDEENPPAPVTLNNRLSKMAWAHWASTGAPTQMQLDAYTILMAEFPPVYDQVKRIGETDLKELEKEVEKLGAPVTPGRLPVWNK